MRRGYKNRWAYDNSPQGDADRKPLPTEVVEGRWHHTGEKPQEVSAATLRELIKYGWLPAR